MATTDEIRPAAGDVDVMSHVAAFIVSLFGA